MDDWVSLGGGNSGCCGNARHTYGFHLPAWRLSTNDYSRRHEPGRPFNMEWACAGDFHHGGDPRLRRMHAVVLARLMHGELPMICEFIGSPWPDRGVYYWARWDGQRTLRRYHGAGHDTWSHISWWRSRADQRALLWRPGGSGVVTPSAATVAPKYPGYVLKASAKANPNVRIWQAQARARGVAISADGVMGPKTVAYVKKFQALNRMSSDGMIGPVTWGAIWDKNRRVA